MNEGTTFNVYCDESCHLEHDHIPVMALGAVRSPAAETRSITESLRKLKAEHGLAPGFEAKWTKVSPAKIEFYLGLIDFFLEDDRLRFHGLVVPDKEQFDREHSSESYDDWHYRMYRTMLKESFLVPNRYRIYLDIKDTKGGPMTRELHRELLNGFHDSCGERIERVQQIRSHESELLQIADILTGALTYANRGLDGSPAKMEIVARLREGLGGNALTCSSRCKETNEKFNVLTWGRKATE